MTELAPKPIQPHRQLWNEDRSPYQLAVDVQRAWDAVPCRYRLQRQHAHSARWLAQFLVFGPDGKAVGGLFLNAAHGLLPCAALLALAKRDIDAAEALARVRAALEVTP